MQPVKQHTAPEEISTLIQQAEALLKDNQLTDGDSLIQESIQLLNNYVGEELLLLKAKAFCISARLKEKQGLFKEAELNAITALDLAEAAKDIKLIIKASSILGRVYLDMAQYIAAVKNFLRSIELCRETNATSALSRNLMNISIVYTMIGDYQHALENLEGAKAAYQQTDNKKGLSHAYDNAGSIYALLGDYEKALTYFDKALEIAHETRNQKSEIKCLTNIAGAYSKTGNYELALEYFNKGLKLADMLNSKHDLCLLYGNLANTYQAMHRFQDALDTMYKALTYTEDGRHQYPKAHWLLGLGLIYGHTENKSADIELAVQKLEEAIKASELLGVPKVAMDANEALYKIFRRQQKWHAALEHLEKAVELNTRMKTEESTRQAEMMEYRRKIEESERDRQVKLARFQEQEKILLNILPVQIAERILNGEKTIADYCEGVSVFFSDIVGFTALSQNISPHQLVSLLNNLFSEFDRIAKKHGLEKIKTIGDAYMAVAGVPVPMADHAIRAANFALEVKETMKAQTEQNGLQIRIGLHTGHAVAGIIGETKFAYDLWGDAVNTASRMESHGETGKIHVSDDFYTILKEKRFEFIERGVITIKGKGQMKTYFLERAL